MANYSDLGAVLTYAGGGGSSNVPIAYGTPPTTFQAGSYANLAIWVKFTLGGSSNFTGYSIKLQGSYDGTTYLDLLKTDNLTTGTTNVEHTITGLTAGNTYWAVYMTSNNRLCKGGLQVLFKGNGGAATNSDTLTVYATGW